MKINTLTSNSIHLPVRSLALRYGALAFGLMLLYFFVVNAVGLQRYEAARFGSHAFTMLAVLLAVRAYKAQSPRPAPYLPGLGLGFLVGLVGSGLFAIFVLLYANVFSSAYLVELRAQTYFGAALGSGVLAATIVLFGVVLGSLTSYTLMMTNGTDAQATTGESTGN
jgi:hypothetical protein